MIARHYHQATKHTWESVRRPGRGLEWSNKPLPFKYYPDLEPMPLPRDPPESSLPAGRVLSGGSGPPAGPLDLPGVARLLFFSAGVTRAARGPAGPVFFRAAPSAGALYPVELYLVSGELEDLEAGVYHFGPVDFSLRRLRPGDHRAVLAEAAADPGVRSVPVSLVLTGIPWRTAWKYGERGYRHLFWDAGTILANTLAVCRAVGLPARVLAGFVDQRVAALLDLGDPIEYPLAVVPVGPTGSPAPEPEDPGPLGLEVHPLSPRPVRHPLLEQAFAAGRLETAGEVEEWRRETQVVEGSRTVERAGYRGVETVGTIEEVILRRGSTRRFRRSSVPRAALEWSLEVAGRPVEADFVAPRRSLIERLVALHAVEGWEPGAYRWEPGALRIIHREASRERSARLCLEQDLGGDAAATVFLLSPLEHVLEHLGDRGYRAAQLEAGIAAGRLHLAPYALGLGATGLTFYDDEVREHFRTRSEPMLVTALGEPDYRTRPGRRPSEAAPLRLVPSG